MTRYSASRGIMYSAPPGPDDDRTADVETANAVDAEADSDGDADATEPAAADD